MENESLPNQLIEALADPKLTEVSGELLEATIDSVMKDGLLKEIPIFGTLAGFFKFGVSIRDRLFTRKLMLFLHESAKLKADARNNMIERLGDGKHRKEAGEKLFFMLEQLDSTEKAKLLGILIQLFGGGRIEAGEFWRASYVIERLPLDDIKELQFRRRTDIIHENVIRRQLYASVGIVTFELSAGSTGFEYQTGLCNIFDEVLRIYQEKETTAG